MASIVIAVMKVYCVLLGGQPSDYNSPYDYLDVLLWVLLLLSIAGAAWCAFISSRQRDE